MSERPKVTLLVVGGLLTAASLAAAIAGGLLGAAVAQRDRDGYVMAPQVRYSTSTYALAVDLGEPIMGGIAPLWLAPGTMRLTIQSRRSEPVFAGIGPAQDVDAYLDGVSHERVRRVYRGHEVDYLREVGNRLPATPRTLAFWTASTTGSSSRTLTWDLRPGTWTLVVMNADAAPGIDVTLQPGFQAGGLTNIVGALVLSGAVGFFIGLVLIVLGGAIPLESGEEKVSAVYPMSLGARLEEPLSRWLWLVKWILAIPHVVILCCLWVAFAVLTIAAFFSIVLTGRYPKPLFATNVGILRWSWRVGFYGYSALATDRYPPFSLRDQVYPTHLDVAYPERMSRGLVLVKWWLLAIPHYLIIAIFSGTSWQNPGANESGTASPHSSGGLLPLLVLFAGIALLFTGKYPRGLFDLIVGLHRWIYRVVTYVALMHDCYPPFRVDLGGDEPLARTASVPQAPS